MFNLLLYSNSSGGRIARQVHPEPPLYRGPKAAQSKGKTMAYRITTFLAGTSLAVFAVAVVFEAAFYAI